MTALRTEGLVVRYGRREVLRGLELAVPRGAIYGFLGRNGAGKTTTLRAVLGLLRPQAGQVVLGDRPWRHVPAHARRGVGYCSQEQVFYDWMDAADLIRFIGAFYPLVASFELSWLLDWQPFTEDWLAPKLVADRVVEDPTPRVVVLGLTACLGRSATRPSRAWAVVSSRSTATPVSAGSAGRNPTRRSRSCP
jgi:hypothetical protein